MTNGAEARRHGSMQYCVVTCSSVFSTFSHLLPTMTLHSIKNTSSIFEDEKLKPGIYKIQNIFTETYVDIETHSRNVCSRPGQNLEEGNGLWEIKPLGAGYSIRRVEPGKPDQFCTMKDEVQKAPLFVTAYPAAWRVEIVDDINHRGFEYVRLFWGTTEWSWAIRDCVKHNGAQVIAWSGDKSITWLMWKLIPFETTEYGFLPSYEGEEAGQSSARAQYADSERDDLGTIVTEVTTVTTTTRRRYRVELEGA
ncbi:hypothetical protein BJ322DRAFT_243236 [Thelephora terrestris]|uniref:Uncharacterized protein n=1 Tax=Thelephora terrestris TaxID=56493 RepID=A0A9P6HBJ3_9AGAM|nr:hypothetical protein BJ322DRAFT_243236 [Thelephora terrestris]